MVEKTGVHTQNYLRVQCHLLQLSHISHYSHYFKRFMSSFDIPPFQFLEENCLSKDEEGKYQGKV